MPTHSQLAQRIRQLYWDYANLSYRKPQFKTLSKNTLVKLEHLYRTYDNRTPIQRPPTPRMRILRNEVYDDYKACMQRFFSEAGAGLSVHTLNVPQTETVANFLAGIRHPADALYAGVAAMARSPRCRLDTRIETLLAEYACDYYFPAKAAGLRVDIKRRMLAFLESYSGRFKIRPPLPHQRRLFMEDYYQYRRRAQEFFDKVGFPVRVECFSLAMIEALLNFIAGNKHPDAATYRKVFTANAIQPVDFFVMRYKPYENSRYPISVGQYHGKRDQLIPLLYFKPADYVRRWFAPPSSTKIKAGRIRLFLNYTVFFERLGITVAPEVLPITYIEAVLNYAESMMVENIPDAAAQPALRTG